MRVEDRARIERLEERLRQLRDSEIRRRRERVGPRITATPRVARRGRGQIPLELAEEAVPGADDRHLGAQVPVLRERRGDDQAIAAAGLRH